MSETTGRDPVSDFEDAWRRTVGEPTRRGGAEAARRAVDRARQRRRRRASAWAVAAAAGLAALAFGVWRAPVARAPVAPVASAPPLAGAAVPATEVVVVWLDEDTALYMNLAPGAVGNGGRP